MNGCVLSIASEDAQFQDTHARIGAMTLRASRLYEVVGPRRAKELLFTCRKLGSREALAYGLVNRIVPRSGLEEAVRSIASEICAQDADTVLAMKAVINDVVRRDYARILSQEIEAKRLFNESKIAEPQAMSRGLARLSIGKSNQ